MIAATSARKRSDSRVYLGIALVAFLLALGVLVADRLSKPPVLVPATPAQLAQIEHVANVRATLERGVPMGTLIEMTDGTYALINQHVSGKETTYFYGLNGFSYAFSPGRRSYDSQNLERIKRVIYPGDADYSAAREQFLPARP